MFGLNIAIAQIILNLKEEENFQQICNSVSPEIAQKLREKREENRKSYIEHQKRLEIARESRSRNFWGYR